MKVVINKCFGGFGVSTAAVLRMRELGSAAAKAEVLKGECYSDGRVNDNDYNSFSLDAASRTDPVLLKVIGEMGEKANGAYAKLAVVEIPDGVKWEIDEYDGAETIHETHRSWS